MGVYQLVKGWGKKDNKLKVNKVREFDLFFKKEF